jgi:7-cyano-7-deazaguanine synthase
MSKKTVVILSGGQDSTTCLFWAREYVDEVYAITFDYAQRHRVEIEAAKTVAKMAFVKEHRIVKLPKNTLLSTSPLTSNAKLETYKDFASMEKIIGDRRELTFVPMRNDLFLTLAANYAEHVGAKSLVTGVCEADNANYSDCRKSFIEAKENAINQALGYEDNGPRMRILTPLIHLTKAKSIELASKIPDAMEALAYTHTCYAGEVPPCGKCHACVLRAEGFAQAGIADPLIERTMKAA